MRYLITAFFFSVLFCSINTSEAQTTANTSGPHLLVYKTRGDYRQKVPVLLSEDKKSILSYPDPADLKMAKGYTLPSLLHKGYLLDNRGIGKNVAFLKMTYKEYAALKSPPSTEELYKMIIDKAPITVLCDCGLKQSFKNPEKQVNSLIDKKQLKKACKTLK